MKKSIHNFLFHRVSPERDILWDPMDVSLFDKCIRYISSRYTVVRIEDLINLDLHKTNQKYATICFDDGYKDNFEYALPILEKYKVKASFYVVTDCIDFNKPTWTHIFENIFQNTKRIDFSISYDFLPPNLKVEKLETAEERISYAKKLKPILKQLSHEQRNLVLDKLTQLCSDVEMPKLMMSWDDIRTMHSMGHAIGSHTVSHCMLGTMANVHEIEAELLNSGNTIKKHLGSFPDTISYPVGSYNAHTIKLVEKVGYKIGLAVKQDVYRPEKDGVFEIPRIELYNESWWKTKLRISNSLETIKKIIKYR